MGTTIRDNVRVMVLASGDLCDSGQIWDSTGVLIAENGEELFDHNYSEGR